jgi:tRNA-splicing ligase RtcB
MNKEYLKRITDYIWEIPKDYRSDSFDKLGIKMRVPARIFASEKMLDDLFKDRSLEQLINVATLPGIQKWALSMPDIHEGYGFPIGGVAAMDIKEGVISPGGIGYDINCIHPDTNVSLSFGARIKIKDLVPHKCVAFLEKNNKRFKEVRLINWFSRRENKNLYIIKSKLGFSLRVTADHPIYDGARMKRAELLNPGDNAIIYPFEGVDYEEPRNVELISKKKVLNALTTLNLSNDRKRHKQILRWLENRDLLTLKLNSWQMPYLIKILGFALGDGTLNLIGKDRKGHVSFYGKKEDLEKIKSDLIKIGISGKIYSRERNHLIKNSYGKIYDFNVAEHSFHVNSTAFAVLLNLLGVPLGNKVEQEFLAPEWLMTAPLWHKRLFLAAFFGAEMSRPATMNKYNFYQPTLNINKILPFKDSAEEFLEQIRRLLGEFGIKSTKIVELEKLGNGGKTAGLRFQIYGTNKNLIKFFGRVGFEYNGGKNRLGNLAIAYLLYKEKIIELRKQTGLLVRNLYQKEAVASTIFKSYAGQYVDKQFIEHSIWPESRNNLRIALNFPSFREFVEKNSYGEYGFIIDEIESIEKEVYDGLVYDITVNHPDHNFIADNFVVSNCGVRILRSEKNFNEIKDKIPALATQLYQEIPSGVGRGGRLKLSDKELDEVLLKGVDKMLESGYATEDDKKHCEAGGCLADADPDLVSETAKKRGRDQLGTIGAGNHFIEVQRVDEIFNAEAAKAVGLFESQVTAMIHCGSRGLGHQDATDYVRIMMSAMPKYGIKLPDLELACVPFNSTEGQHYWKSMAASANFAWANRQFITWEVRRAWEKIFGDGEELKLIYDVAHNLAKLEEYDNKKVVVHRKGATRSFPGQAVLIPGSMGTASYVLIGQPRAMELSFGSTCHGAGRMMSRTKAKKQVRGSVLKQELEKQGIAVRSGSMSGLAEEAPFAYKDVDEVVNVVHNAGLAKKVARLKPVAVIKG